MSHIVTIQSKLHDAVALGAACQRLGLQAPTQGTAKLFSGEASGLLIELPHWQYPVVVDPLSGTLKYDNFEGHWGDQAQLDHLLQIYAVEKAKLEARKRGYTVSEQTLQDGSIKIQLHEGRA